MSVVKKNKPKLTSTALRSWPAYVCRLFASISEIDAIFASADNSAIHLYSVVREFDESLYGRLLKKEGRLEKEFPELSFDFHVRAHQGRKPYLAVPFGAELVFAR